MESPSKCCQDCQKKTQWLLLICRWVSFNTEDCALQSLWPKNNMASSLGCLPGYPGLFLMVNIVACSSWWTQFCPRFRCKLSEDKLRSKSWGKLTTQCSVCSWSIQANPRCSNCGLGRFSDLSSYGPSFHHRKSNICLGATPHTSQITQYFWLAKLCAMTSHKNMHVSQILEDNKIKKKQLFCIII